YSSNWVSKRTRTRHMKTQHTCQKLTIVSSESSNLELLSNKNNDQINDKLKPVCDQDLSWLDSDIEMQNSFETQDLFLLDINAETSLKLHLKFKIHSNLESFLEDEFFTYNTISDDFSNFENNYLVDEFSTYTELDNNISEELAITLRLFKVNIQYNLTDKAFRQTIVAVNAKSISLHLVKKKLKLFVDIEPIWMDMCFNSCYTYTGNYQTLVKCPICKLDRYYYLRKNRKSQQQFVYFSLGQRLSIQYRDYDHATELRYRFNYVIQNNNQIGDIFDGTYYKELVQMVVLVINANLALEIRFKKENLLISLIIPGPKEPKNLITFLYPMIKELQNLEESFTLHTAVVNWSDNTPGLTKLMCITGHNSYRGCRYCNLKGIHTNHIYYPTILPTNVNSIRYCASNLPKRSINKHSTLFDLLSIHFPDSFIVDIMHLFYENIAKYMFEHWTGTFFSDELQNKEPYVLKKSVWIDIGKQMHAFHKDLPSKLGRLLHNIMLHNRRYKAEEWAAWITMYLLLLLKG
ncbi:11950_t:CDS:2, partial [Gigaspora margarita]